MSDTTRGRRFFLSSIGAGSSGASQAFIVWLPLTIRSWPIAKFEASEAGKTTAPSSASGRWH